MVFNIGVKKDLKGMIFGHLKVIEATKNNKNQTVWLCECDCENHTQALVDSARLISGVKIHCGCKKEHHKRKNIILPKEYIGVTKFCSECKTEKELKEFYFTKKLNKDGEEYYYFNPRCIECDKDNARKWKSKNPEKAKKCFANNNYTPQSIKRRTKYTKIQRENGYRKEWESKNRDKLKQYNKKHRNHEISENEWLLNQEYFNNCCAYCGKSYNEQIEQNHEKFHKEHVDDKGYNDVRNCVPACTQCNTSKHTSDIEEWYYKQSFFSIERYNKIQMWVSKDYKNVIEEKPPYRIMRERNKDNRKYHYNLWSVDERRNMIDIIATENERQDLDIHIENYLIELRNKIIQ